MDETEINPIADVSANDLRFRLMLLRQIADESRGDPRVSNIWEQYAKIKMELVRRGEPTETVIQLKTLDILGEARIK